MRSTSTLTGFVFIVAFFLSVSLSAQGNDCIDFLVICNDASISFNPTGPGNNDFASSANSNGCLSSNEHQSAWYYFSFNSMTPPNSQITFVINPNAGGSQDYDFAVFGPNLGCDNLGSPLRCSYAAGGCAFCPQTGLGMGASDFSESPGGDGFVAPITVNAGDGFYLLIDNFSNNSTGYQLSWGGGAAPFLDCNPPVVCTLMATAPPAQTACGGTNNTQLSVIVTGQTGSVSYFWSGTGAAGSYLSNPTSPTPTLTIPAGFSGILTYTVAVTDNLCTRTTTVTVNVLPPPMPMIDYSPTLCFGETQLLNAGFGYSSYQWSTGTSGQTLQILQGGTYSVTVTNASGCIGSASVTITEVPLPMPVISGPTGICPGGFDQLTVNPIYQNYFWSTGSNTFGTNIFDAGTYTVTVTDANGCQADASFTVPAVPGPVPTIVGPSTICLGQSGTLSLSSSFPAYEWSTQEFTPSIEIFQAGIYSVTVTDINGCTGVASLIVDTAPSPQPTISGNLQICAGSTTTLTVNQPYQNYYWSNNMSGSSITVSQPGNYEVTVTTATGCVGTASVNVTLNQTPSPVITGDLNICPGETTTLSLTNNYASYVWNTTATTPTINVSTPGTYMVTVTNNQGCSAGASVVVNGLAEPTVSISGGTEFCAGGSLTLTAMGSFATVEWSNNATSNSITVTSAGTYTVTAYSAGGCSATAQVTVIANTPVPVTITGTNATCAGTGTTFTAVGTYSSYLWSNGGTGASINITMPGAYSVTATDANGCTTTATRTLSNFALPTPSINGPGGICSDGAVTLTVQGSFSTYLWQDGTTASTLPVTTAGSYSVTVTNTNGCEASASFTLAAYPDPQPAITGSAAFCAGSSTTLGLSQTYSAYTWSTGATTPTITVTTAQDISVQITDANGCSAEATIQTTVNPLPAVPIAGNRQFCVGNSTVLSGPPNMATYLWSTGSTQQSITANAATTYILTVTDANGCSNTNMATTSILAELEPELVAPAAFCPGASATISVVNNYATYQWSDNSTGAELTITQPGTYTVTVTDAAGCMGSTDIVVDQFTLASSSIVGDDDFCTGDSTQVQLSQPYVSYEWSTGATTSSVTIQQGGSYAVTVTDSNQCLDSLTIDLTEYALPTPVVVGDLSFCPEGSSMLSTATAYTAYQWSTGVQTAMLTVTTEANFSVTVTDSNGCQGETSVSTAYFPTTVPDISGALAFCPDGSTSLGTTPSFSSYIWSTGATAPTINVSTPGTIGVTVTDANGCVTENAADLTNFIVTSPALSAPSGFCADTTATILAPATYSNYLWSTGSTMPTTTVMAEGTYGLTVTDTNGCQSDSEINVLRYPLPQPAITGSLTYCIGNSTELAAANVYPSYTWSDGSTSNGITVTTPGSYGLTVTDTNGCMGETNVAVQEATSLSPQIAGNNAICEGNNAILDAGPNYATYIWSTGETGSTITVSDAGTYGLTVSDNGGCMGETTLNLIVNPLPQPAILGDAGFCVGESLSLMADQPYASYNWSTGNLSSQINVNTPGTYTLNVTDSNGCTNSVARAITEFSLPIVDIQGTDYFCSGGSTDLTAQAGNVMYVWSTGATVAGITATQPGNYLVTVTDTNGCEGEDNFMVAQIALPVADAGTPQAITCAQEVVTIGGPNSSTGNYSYQWTTTAPGNAPGNLPDPGVSTPGTYTLVVVDNVYGCSSTPASVSIGDQTQEPFVVVQALNVIDCNTSSVIIDGTDSQTGSNLVYQWYDSQNNVIPNANGLTYEATTPQLYILQVLNTLTGCAAQDSINLEENIVYPFAEAGAGPRLDCIQTSVVLDGSSSESGGSIAYVWTSADGNPIQQNTTTMATVQQPGWYFIEVADVNNGCRNRDSVLVTQNVLPPSVALGDDQELDCVNTSFDLSGQILAIQGTPVWRWTRNGMVLPTATTINYTATEPGLYVLQLTDGENGCVASDQLRVTSNEAMPVDLSLFSDIPTCAGDADGSLAVSQVVGGTPPYLYSINGGSFTANSNFANLSAGTYNILIQDALGCELNQEFVLMDGNDLTVDLGPDVEITYGDSTSFTADVSVDLAQILTYRWSPGNILSCTGCATPSFSPPQSVVVFVTVTDINGCQASDDLIINVERKRPIYAPTAFSPNGDDTNDVFYLQGGSEVVAIKSLYIYNRWGEAVFSIPNDHAINDPTLGWNGYYREQLMNSAVFVWVAEIEFTDGEIEVFKGDVALVR